MILNGYLVEFPVIYSNLKVSIIMLRLVLLHSCDLKSKIILLCSLSDSRKIKWNKILNMFIGSYSSS